MALQVERCCQLNLARLYRPQTERGWLGLGEQQLPSWQGGNAIDLVGAVAGEVTFQIKMVVDGPMHGDELL